MAIMQPNFDEVRRIIEAALAEDIGAGDVTSQRLIAEAQSAEMAFVAREALVVCGTEIVPLVFYKLNPQIRCIVHAPSGSAVEKGAELIYVEGPARAILAAERVALNLLQRMSSVATLTAKYVKAVRGTKAIILDTRKTMPGLRELDKYAVRAGGGRNHRMRLDDAILIKDNHIAVCGGVAEAIKRARAGRGEGGTLPIIVECDTPAQVEAALQAGADRILLDNMTPDTLKQAVSMAAGRVKLEASGGVNLDNVRAIAESGVDFISVGRLTHSAPAVDIGLDVAIK